MMTKNVEEVRTRILEAAQIRFAQYGFGKTTMAEIAKDCDMSAANLYRFFENKEEIGAEVARQCFIQQDVQLRAVVQRPGMTAGERLEAFILENLRFNYELFSDQPRLMELVEFISQERWDLIERKLEGFRSLLAEILAEGNRTGEFDVPDILATAGVIREATAKFCNPYSFFMGRFSLAELEEGAKGVVRLIVRGMAKR